MASGNECVGDTGMNVKRSKIDRIFNFRMEHDLRISAVNTVIRDHHLMFNVCPWTEQQEISHLEEKPN